MPITSEQAIRSLALVSTRPLEEFKDHINATCCQLTGSTLSYFATIDATERVLTMIGWSKSAMMSCAMMTKPIVYKMEDTGLWGDAVRERKPVITNDYKSLVKPTKKGYPQGHVNVRRHMNLPIFEGKHIALVIGVGNKLAEYTNDDAKTLQEFMDAVWKLLKPKL
ncbi:MAG: GAF domain-containing protein [Terracidiphilus sp.]|jgi:hypothetical protein